MKNGWIVATTFSVCTAGCGGGGSGDSTSASSTPTAPTTPTVPPMVQQNLQVAQTPNYAAGSEELGFFNTVNAFRAQQGEGPLIQDAHYDAAAQAHSNYCDLNGVLTHGETSGLPGYTGNTPQDRVEYQGGVATLVAEEGGTGDQQGAVGSGASFANVLINSVYHRAALIFQGVTTTGNYIDMTTTQIGHSFAELGYNVNQQVNAGNFTSYYPFNGQTGVSLHFHGEEPSPVPAGADVTTFGSPIHFQSQQSTTLTVTAFTVTPQNSTTPLPATLILGSQDPNLAGNNNLAFLLPTVAYQPNTTYTVNFVGTITGTATGSATGIPVNQTWSFTTGTTSY
jgi:uncharacterized protein YkwD